MSEDVRARLERLRPAAAHLSRELLSVDAKKGEVRLAFASRPEFLNRHGTVQGGFLSAKLDSAAVCALLCQLAEPSSVVTRSLHVSFLHPASPGRLEAHARVVERRERDVESEASLQDEDGRVVARCLAQLRVVGGGDLRIRRPPRREDRFGLRVGRVPALGEFCY